MLTTSGSLVKVTLGASTDDHAEREGEPVELRPGDTVVVQGATARNGNVAATSVAATAPGVTAAGGGFGRGAGFGGGAASTGGG